MIERFNNKNIGIWGFGVTGQSILRHSAPHAGKITIFEQKALSDAQEALARTYNAHVATGIDPQSFLEKNDYIIASPGIDLDPYHQYAHKFIAELDLFHATHTKKTIAITGSAGKTSITYLLDQILRAAQKKVATGGNIGTGMLDLLANSDTEFYLLELSSFQLEQCTTFAPDLAIITNLYPNHLDRHKTMDRYFDAKYRMVAHQIPPQMALVPLSLLRESNNQPNITENRCFFSWSTPTIEQVNELKITDTLFYANETHIIMRTNQTETPIFEISEIPPLSYKENWLIITSALHMLNIPLGIISECCNTLTLPEHRLELVTTINEIDFYNDSKATTNQATMTAVHALQGRPIHLFLGGLSKGVDRTPLIQYLKDRVTHIYCFGKEAEHLHVLCSRLNIPSSSAHTLNDAFTTCMEHVRPHDQVLLSPGGASFDLFKDYEERGRVFKKIVWAQTLQDC